MTTYADRGAIQALESAPPAALEAAITGFTMPDAPEWLLIMALIDSNSRLTFGSTGNAEVAGFLVDQQCHQLIWRNRKVQQTGQGGLIGMTMKGMMEEGAI